MCINFNDINIEAEIELSVFKITDITNRYL